jgi:hypothetical protein
VVNVIWWLGLSYLCAFLVMAAAVAMLSLSVDQTSRLLDEDVRR